MGHEVVDGAAGFWLLQPLIGRQGATECIHHPDLSLDAVQASEPEDLSSAELPLGVVDLLHVLHVLQLLVGDLLLLGAVACGLQELQTAGGDRRDQLTPEETAEAQEDAPQPLVDGQAHTAEGLPTKLHNDNLDDEGTKDDGAEDEVVEDAIKDVPLAVDLAGVDLVEELHHDEGVEDDGVVLRGGCVQGGVPPAVYIKYLFTNEQ